MSTLLTQAERLRFLVEFQSSTCLLHDIHDSKFGFIKLMIRVRTFAHFVHLNAGNAYDKKKSGSCRGGGQYWPAKNRRISGLTPGHCV